MIGLEHRPSQEDRILELLESRGDTWTPAPELAGISLQYCARINSLRKQGYRIDNRVERHGDVTHGFYRLAPEMLPAESKSSQQSNGAAQPQLFSLEAGYPD